jgi:hypothetical protein
MDRDSPIGGHEPMMGDSSRAKRRWFPETQLCA